MPLETLFLSYLLVVKFASKSPLNFISSGGQIVSLMLSCSCLRYSTKYVSMSQCSCSGSLMNFVNSRTAFAASTNILVTTNIAFLTINLYMCPTFHLLYLLPKGIHWVLVSFLDVLVCQDALQSC